VAFVAVGGLVYALSRVLRFRYRTWSFANPRRSSLYAIAAVLIGWILVSGLFLLVTGSQSVPHSPPGERDYTASDVISQAIVALILVGPALLVMRWRREPWASAGVSIHNLGRSFVIGTLLAALSIIAAMLSGKNSVGELVAGLTISHFWTLLQYAIVGFGEEFALRGYLQTRLAAWLGRWQGWVLASVLMALAHVVQRMTMEGLPLPDAVISSASLVPISLLLGYVMLRTENVIAPALFHTFANWVNILG
jgi:membrane protease YdiL (CAAX protease family)